MRVRVCVCEPVASQAGVCIVVAALLDFIPVCSCVYA